MTDQMDTTSERWDVKTIHGTNHMDKEPHKEVRMSENGQMVWVRSGDYEEDGSEWHMIPMENIDRIKDFRVPLPSTDGQETDEDDEAAASTEEEREEKKEQTVEYLLNQTISELEDFIGNIYTEEVLEDAIEQDDRVGATELYEDRLAELQE